MKLKNVAKLFDKLVLSDAYNPATTFKGQFDLYDDSRRDGMSVERRILSVAPDVTIPARRTIQADGLTWLVGDDQRDYYKTGAIRHKHVIHLASELASIKTFDQVIANSAGLQAWATRNWTKGAKEIEISSEVTNIFDIYFAAGESVPVGSLVSLAGRWHIVRQTHPSTAGLLVAVADELEEPVRVSVTLTTRTYVPLTDSYTTGTVSVTGVQMRWQSYFQYPTKASERYQSGDLTLILRKVDATPTAGDKLTIGTENYNVMSVISTSTDWVLHLRND